MPRSATLPAEPHIRRRRRTWRRALVGVLTVALLATPSLAHADWGDSSTAVPEGPEGSEVEAGKRLSSDVAITRDGTAWAAWILTDDTTATITPAATQTLLVARRPAGGSWQAPEAIGTIQRAAGSNFDSGSALDIDVDQAGRPTVAWSVISGSGSTLSGLSVITRSRGTDGTWSEPASFDTTTSAAIGPAYPVSLDVAADGNAVLAWQLSGGTYLARRASNGTWGGKVTVEEPPTTAPNPDTVGVGLDKEGRAVVAWRAWDEDSEAWDVRARLQSAGGSWTAAAQTLADDVPLANRISVAVDIGGAALATWGSSEGARAAFRPAGTASAWTGHTLSEGSANSTVDTTAANLISLGKGVPSASFDPYGTATVVWPEVDPEPRVALASVSPTGEWGETETVATGTSPNVPVAPRINASRDGQAQVAWTRAVNLTIVPGVGVSLSGGEIYATERSATGEWTDPKVYTTPSNGSFGSVSALGGNAGPVLTVAGDALGDAVLGWTPYASSMAPGLQQIQTVAHTGSRELSLEWTGRKVGGSTNINSWLNYIKTDWPAGGATCPQGLHGVEIDGEASFPSADDEDSWRFAFDEAYKNTAGVTVVQYKGTLRWVNEAHCIDIRLTDPRLEIAADGASARVYVDGQTSGSMSDAIGGNPSTTPFTNLRLLQVDLSDSGPRGGDDTATWLSAPTTLTTAAASTLGLDLYSGQSFGHLTVGAPETVRLKPTVAITAPDSIAHGSAAEVEVSVAGATGQVTLTGAGDEQSKTLSGGKATFTLPTSLAAGSHTLTVEYGGDDEYASASATHELTVSKAASGLAVSAPRSTYGKAARVTVTAPGRTGKVTVTAGGATRTATLAAGAATVQLPKTLRAGRHTVTVTHPGGSGQAAATGSATLTVARATVTFRRLKVTKRPTSKRTGRATVAVRTATGTTPTGRVTVRLKKGKTTKTVRVRLKNGKATVRLPKAKKGTWRLTVGYPASTNFTKASKTIRVKVRR